MNAADLSAASPVVRAVVRTCVGCRRRAPVAELLRVVVGPAGTTAPLWVVQPDPRRRAAGRGAYVHPDPVCVASAERRRAFGRALRVPGGTDSSPVVSYVTALGT